MRLLVLAALLLGALFAGPARAAERGAPVLILEPRVHGDLRAEQRARLGDALWAALDRLGLRRVPDSDRDSVLQAETSLRACLDRDECLERLGHLLEAGHVIALSLQHSLSGSFALQVRLFDVDVGQDGARVEWSCERCTAEDVARQLDSLVEQVVSADRLRPRATLVVRSAPPNADVQIDGRKVGFTELERPVFAGAHDLIVSRIGLAPERMRVEVSGQQRVTLLFSLGPEDPNRPPPPQRLAAPALAPRPAASAPPLAPRPAPAPRRRPLLLAVGIPLLVLGLATAGLGATSLVLDGKCVGSESPCTRAYDGLVAGAVELSLGGAATAAGVGLLIRWGRN